VIADGPLAGDGRTSQLRSDLTVGIDLSEQEKTERPHDRARQVTTRYRVAP